MKQTTLFNVPTPKPPRKRKSAAVRRAERESHFAKFHAENPRVYSMLREMALKLKQTGHDHWGMRNLYEKCRYDLAVQTTETAPVLNDHFAPMYARMLMEREPALVGMFETRERR